MILFVNPNRGILFIRQSGEAPPVAPTHKRAGGGTFLGIKPRFKEPKIDIYRDQILHEDNEILEVIMAFILKD